MREKKRMKTTHLPQVRVSEKFLKEVENRADDEQMNISEYIRYVLKKDIDANT